MINQILSKFDCYDNGFDYTDFQKLNHTLV